MKIKQLLLVAVILSAANSGWAQEKAPATETRPLTLKEAVDLGLKNSHELKNSAAKIDEATAALREAVEQKLPGAKASGSYLRLNSANIKLRQEQDNSGGTPPDEPTKAPKVSQAMYGLLNLSLPIYAGGKIRYGIESSRYLAEASKLDADFQKEEVAQNIVEAYINLYKAKAAVELVKDNLAQSQQRVKDFTNLEKNGILARNDLLKAELQASNTELTLLDVQNNWELANVNMDLMLGLPTTTRLEPDSSIAEAAEAVMPLEDYVQSALKGRKDISALSLQRKATETGVKIAKADKYPSLALTGGYVALDVPKVLTVTNAVNIGVGVSYDIASLWKSKSKIQQAEARSRQMIQNEAIVGDQVVLQVNQSYLNLLSSRKKIEVYAKAVEQAQENYRITKNKYDNSLATTTDLLDADVASLQAKLNYVFAKADAVVAYDKLLQTAGMPVQ
ncbi:MAG: TolC family protein [Chitinophagaceae bacterium]|nr:MAG: TolC family protein [Chitinophagaceae bacterium]